MNHISVKIAFRNRVSACTVCVIIIIIVVVVVIFIC